jgi:hypothetical protein
MAIDISAQTDGFIKLYRKLLTNKIFNNPTSLKIYIWCLLRASHKKRSVNVKIGKGLISVELQPGQFIFGRSKAAQELKMHGSTIYKWMQKLSSKEYNEIEIVSNRQYSIVTLCKWHIYQSVIHREVTTKEQPNRHINKFDNQVFSNAQSDAIEHKQEYSLIEDDYLEEEIEENDSDKIHESTRQIEYGSEEFHRLIRKGLGKE